MTSLRAHVLNRYLKLTERRFLSRLQDPSDATQRLEFHSRWTFADVPGSREHKTVLCHAGSEVPALVSRPLDPRSDAALLYLHGGGYAFGSAESHRRLAVRIGWKANLPAFLPEYRLSPEAPYPSALDDALTSYLALRARGYRHIIVAGDSAGGGLSFALLHRICAKGLPQPTATIGLSAWTDLTGSSPSMTSNVRTEYVLPPERMAETAAGYYGDTQANDPGVSPVFGTFKGAGPVLLQVSGTEILCDDTYRLADRLREDEVDVSVQTWDDTSHVWQFFHDRLPEANEAVESIEKFIDGVLPPRPARHGL